MNTSEPNLFYAWLRGLGLISGCHLVFWLPQRHTKGGAVLVETNGVAEKPNGVVRCEGQCVRDNDADARYRFPL